MTKLSFPFTEENIRALKVGDEVLISGVAFTGRDAIHKHLHEGGGAAQVLAECIKKARNVYFLEKFGSSEAIRELEVVDLAAVVTIDAHGNSLHKEIFAASQAELAKRW